MGVAARQSVREPPDPRQLPLAVAASSRFVAGVAAYDTHREAGAAAGHAAASLLKWPNDVLLADERSRACCWRASEREGDRSSWSSARHQSRTATRRTRAAARPSLAAYGIDVAPAERSRGACRATHYWLARWGEGFGFSACPTRVARPRRAYGRTARSALNGEEIEGSYAGLDSDGALVLKTERWRAQACRRRRVFRPVRPLNPRHGRERKRQGSRIRVRSRSAAWARSA